MGEFGSQLRKERESRGIDLDSICNSTKISSRYLLALEHDRFEQLPGGVFNKGIVRSYARVVGIDEDEWVNRYMAAYQQSGKLKDDDANWIAFAENVSRAREAQDDLRPDKRLRWAGVAVLLLVLVGLGWFVWRYVHTKISEEGALHLTGVSYSSSSASRSSYFSSSATPLKDLSA